MRKVVGLVVAVLVLLLLALLAGQWLQRSLAAAGLEQVHWQQLRWRDGAVQLGQLSAVQVSEQGRLGLAAEGIRLRPVWRGGPRIEQLLIDELQLVWQAAQQLPAAAVTEQPFALPALDDFADVLGWLPQHLHIRQLRVQLPCEEAYCELRGSLQLNSEAQPLALTAQLDLLAQEQAINGRLQLHEQADSYRVQADVQIPEALPLAGLGQLSGQLQLDLENHGEQWLLHQGQVQGRLEQPQLEALSSLPPGWRPTALAVQVTPQPLSLANWQDSLQLALQVQMHGAIEGQLSGDLALASQPHWQAELSQARLQLSAPNLAMDDIHLQRLELDWPLQGTANAGQLSLTLGEQAPLSVRRLALADGSLALSGVSAQLGGSRLLLPLDNPAQLSLSSPLQVGVQQLQQAALRPQGWNLQGDLQQTASGLRFNGQLAALSGLNAQLQLDWPSGQDWQLNMTPGDIFLRAANPLASTFSDWPTLLSFSSGRVTGQLQASGRDSLQRLNGQLTLTGGEGIYDRTSFSGLNLPLSISLQGERLHLGTQALSLSSVDPGLVLGPLRASGSYRASMDNLTAGVVELADASIGVLEGRVGLAPGTIDLGQSRQSLVAVVEGVELARLFEVYPAEGLSGRGTLDGRFPVSLVEGKLLIEDGRLQARQPGGVLRYRARQLQEMAASNPNMQQLAAALDDFHYRVLASDVAYDEQGVLLLGLRLEGSNPAFQQGRQVNLNIQLEEDIPALLTSLQLSGQVNEIIRKRIEQNYLQRSNP